MRFVLLLLPLIALAAAFQYVKHEVTLGQPSVSCRKGRPSSRRLIRRKLSAPNSRSMIKTSCALWQPGSTRRIGSSISAWKTCATTPETRRAGTACRPTDVAKWYRRFRPKRCA